MMVEIRNNGPLWLKRGVQQRLRRGGGGGHEGQPLRETLPERWVLGDVSDEAEITQTGQPDVT